MLVPAENRHKEFRSHNTEDNEARSTLAEMMSLMEDAEVLCHVVEDEATPTQSKFETESID